jgi:molecular chaperone DnaK (HSP70)
LSNYAAENLLVSANLIGIDFGSTFMKATLVKPGQPFAIVENTASGRKTESMVTLGSENRLYGKDSFLESSKYPLTTFSDLHRTFGKKFDSDELAKFKEQRFVTNEYVADERGNIALKVTRAKHGDSEEEEEILYSEEIMAMLLSLVKGFAEKQAEGGVRDCVITVPSWFTYDQRLMVRDAAERMAGLKVLQLVHENVAAATMFGIDKKMALNETLTVLFYNMGAMDTEATIVRYSVYNVSAKKTSPYIDILAESHSVDSGIKDLDLKMVHILADKFNALKEREGKPDVRTN